MQAIPDLMAHLAELDDGTVRQVRKTAEDPPRVSVYDVIGTVTGLPQYNMHTIWSRLCES